MFFYLFPRHTNNIFFMGRFLSAELVLRKDNAFFPKHASPIETKKRVPPAGGTRLVRCLSVGTAYFRNLCVRLPLLLLTTTM